MDSWNLFLEALKQKNFGVYAIFKSFTPVRIEDGNLFIYTNKEFMKLVAEDELDKAVPILKYITGLVLEGSTHSREGEQGSGHHCKAEKGYLQERGLLRPGI